MSSGELLRTSTCGTGTLAGLELDHAVVELAFAELLEEALALAAVVGVVLGDDGEGGGRVFLRGVRIGFGDGRLGRAGLGGGALRDEEFDEALFGEQLGAVFHVVELLFAHHVDGDLHEVAHDGFDVAADVADLGELRGFHLEEGRVGELGEAAGDLGFADAGRADHEDVFRHDLFGEIGRKLLAAGAIAQRDGHGALGGGLADDVLVELGDDLARRHLVERECLVFSRAGKENCHLLCRLQALRW
jgi:hypothetical protein